MKLLVLAVGKLRDDGTRGLCDDYRRRIARHARIEIRELKDSTALSKAVETLSSNDRLVTLQVKGKAPTSTELARQVERWRHEVHGSVALVIGGANGIPPEVDRQAAARLSLSNLTLPHRLARVLLLEQLYRAFSIINGEPYARED